MATHRRMTNFFFFFSCSKWDPKSPRGRYSRNTWHGKFVNPCMQNEHTPTHTHGHTHADVCVDRTSSPACFSAPCVPFLSSSSVLLSKWRSWYFSVKPPFFLFFQKISEAIQIFFTDRKRPRKQIFFSSLFSSSRTDESPIILINKSTICWLFFLGAKAD